MIYYSNDEKKKVVKMLEMGISVPNIIKKTGMSKATVFRIRRKAIEEKPEIENKSAKVEISVGYIESVIDELICVKKYELAKNLIDQITNNDKTNEDIKAMMQCKLIKIDIEQGEYDTAEAAINEILDNSNVSNTYKVVAQRRLVQLNIAKNDFGKAKEIITDIICNENAKSEEKQKAQSQLIKIHIKEGNYNTAKQIAEEMIENSKLPEDTVMVLQSQLITIAILEGNHEEAKQIASEVLNNPNTKSETVDMIHAQLVSIAIYEGKYGEATEMAKGFLLAKDITPRTENVLQKKLMQIEGLRKRSKRINYKLKHRIKNSKDNQTESAIKKEEFIAESNPEIVNNRKKLYNGEIDINSIKNLTEENNGTIKGNLFIAEMCGYFDLQELGIQCLKGYKKLNNPTDGEIKIISRALDLLKKSDTIKIRQKENWDKLYKAVEKTTGIER